MSVARYMEPAKTGKFNVLVARPIRANAYFEEAWQAAELGSWELIATDLDREKAVAVVAALLQSELYAAGMVTPCWTKGGYEDVPDEISAGQL